MSENPRPYHKRETLRHSKNLSYDSGKIAVNLEEEKKDFGAKAIQVCSEAFGQELQPVEEASVGSEVSPVHKEKPANAIQVDKSKEVEPGFIKIQP